MQQYLDLMRHVLTVGHRKEDRTGTGTISTFGYQTRFNLRDGFPLVTTKKVHLKSIIHELLWFLQGSTDIRYLKENGVGIWDEWVNDPVYEPLTPEEMKEAIRKEETASGLWDKVVFEEVETEDPEFWAVEACVGGGVREIIYDKRGGLASLYRTFFKSEPQKLVAGDLGPVYGKQWRDWVGPNGEHIDQIKNVISRLKTHPDCRRLIVSAWNVGELDKMALMPCHSFFQFWTRELTHQERIQVFASTLMRDGKIMLKDIEGADTEAQKTLMDKMDVPTRALSCQMYQRSSDVFLGVCFNIASYALLTMMVAQVVNMVPDEFIWTSGDTHLYTNHLEQVDLQLSREPRALPTMRLNPDVKDIFDFTFEDFTLEGYDPHPAIKAPVAV